MERIAIDLTWIRHGKVGGTESSTINLLAGIEENNYIEYEFYLIVAKDNYEHLRGTYEEGIYKYIIVNTSSANQIKRVLWQNICLCRVLKKHKITKCIEPIYSIPFTRISGIKFYATIHDLQAYHYPEYFNVLRKLWMYVSWKNTIRRAHRIIAISDFVKKDIESTFRVDDSKITRIYDSIDVDETNIADKEVLSKFAVNPREYYYTVSSLLPHKNLKTLLYVMDKIKKDVPDKYFPLVISGVGGPQKKEILSLADEFGIIIILTGYIENSIRNRLYSDCYIFLFPSVFEGFGMPPIEAMILGASVITTNKTCMPEVTMGQAVYVDKPYDLDEWIDKIINIKELENSKIAFKCYEKKNIAKQYLDLLSW